MDRITVVCVISLVHCVQEKTPTCVFLHNSYKYQPIEVKTSDNITDRMLHVKSENKLYVRSIFFVSSDVIRTLVTLPLQHQNLPLEINIY